MTEPTRSGAEGFSFSDKRRIDPETFEVREQSAAPSPGGDQAEVIDDADIIGEEIDLDVRDAQIAELTADVQRVQAEYANYRKRVDRERATERDRVVATTLAEFLPVLDDVERARAHGDLEGSFKIVGESLENTVTRLGMSRFGEPGDAFDYNVHSAIASEPSVDVEVKTVTAVHQQGYKFGDRMVRPAIVSVADPE